MPHSSDFGTFGRFTETSVAEMAPAMKDAYDFTMGLRGLVPGPHKIWLANPTLSKTIVPTGYYFQKQSTLTKGEIEIATNVICGQWRCAYALYEHEKIGEEKGGLSKEQLEALIGGRPTSFSDPRQQIVYELSVSLAAQRVISVSLYRRAEELLGVAGIVDVTVLMGWFSMVCLTLNAFDVPSNAVGLDQ